MFLQFRNKIILSMCRIPKNVITLKFKIMLKLQIFPHPAFNIYPEQGCAEAGGPVQVQPRLPGLQVTQVNRLKITSSKTNISPCCIDVPKIKLTFTIIGTNIN